LTSFILAPQDAQRRTSFLFAGRVGHLLHNNGLYAGMAKTYFGLDFSEALEPLINVVLICEVLARLH